MKEDIKRIASALEILVILQLQKNGGMATAIKGEPELTVSNQYIAQYLKDLIPR